jgi:hypothetical protein
MRNIELLFDAVDYATCEIPQIKLDAAVGYLSTWSIDGYPFVRIMLDARNREFIATYWSAQPQEGKRPDYVIGAIWHDDTEHFSFHS